MAIQFQSKKFKEARGLLGIYISKNITRVEDRSSLKARADWYRKLLGIENALFFSENVDVKGSVTSETLVILDALPENIDAYTEIIFASEGKTGKYTIPLFTSDSLMSDIKELFRFIKELEEKPNSKEELTQWEEVK